MKLARIALAAALIAGVSVPSLAQITGDTTISGVTLEFGPNPTHLDDKIKGNSDVNGVNPLVLITDSGHLVDFTSTTAGLTQTGNNGFATVRGPASGSFVDLLITPQAPTNGFTAINFNPMPVGNGNNTYYGDIILFQVLGGPVSFLNVAFATNGNNHFGIFSNDDRAFSSILFTNLHLGVSDTTASVQFESMRQVSIELAPGAVPEPSTWAMMLLGFGGIGVAMRRRRKPAAVTQAV